ncbi:MAG: HEAT repeat domain-containing protein [Saprospiraceae bacterium]|nr:HEAT repeat domain-containing protein [Saprospiraceae bacterium]
MEQQDFNQQVTETMLIDYLNGRLGQTERLKLENLIQNNHEIGQQFAETKALWQAMSQIQIPAPTKKMDADFFEMLDEFKTGSETKISNSFWSQLKNLTSHWFDSKLAFGMTILVLGCLLGYSISGVVNMGNNFASGSKVERLSEDVQSMKELMMLAMLQNPQATERMKAVNYTAEMTDVDSKVLNALFSTFQFDPNDNVRIVALNALVKWADKPQVRQVLLTALMEEKSPLVQVALADAMIKLQERKSIQPLQEKLNDKELNIYVKDKFENTIELLSI